VEGNLAELGLGMLLRGLQHGLQLHDALLHCSGHFLSLCRCLWTLVKGGSEALADFPHTAAQLVSLEEQDEDGLALVQTLRGKGEEWGER